MSQYALYLSKKEIHSKDVYYVYNKFSDEHNGYELDKIFGIERTNVILSNFSGFLYRIFLSTKYPGLLKTIRFILKGLSIYMILEAINYDFNPNVLKYNRGIIFYYGGWHSEKYFCNQENLIRTRFTFDDNKLNVKSKHIREDILSQNSISIHIRKGDYLLEKHYKTFGCVCDLEYYQEAVSYICERVDKPVFYIFSNDFGWVKDNIILDNAVYVDWNNDNDSWMDMCLMTHCKHNIISNSTFSWWGAWLNNYKNKIVVRPSEFIHNVETRDIYPEQWIKI